MGTALIEGWVLGRRTRNGSIAIGISRHVKCTPVLGGLINEYNTV
jgi:hypothetical protein